MRPDVRSSSGDVLLAVTFPAEGVEVTGAGFQAICTCADVSVDCPASVLAVLLFWIAEAVSG
ncbi:thioredoxin-like proteins [Acetobacter aceti NRIC 0242]|nr:hypothetical protein Abac_017_057 [Acetobacter aceti NBRC 14818]GBO81459.1 thioredoxin-like proteins [Acetobacter aceti NRIC 0242]